MEAKNVINQKQPQRLIVNIESQTLILTDGEGLVTQYPVSTAANGVGQNNGSGQTPLGCHRVFAKIGKGLPLYSVFVGRRWTGEVWSESLEKRYPSRDWILSRILWLDGLEPGVNRSANVDSKRRFIYFHGTNEEHLIGKPSSHGCVRLNNSHMVEIFDAVELGARVSIVSDQKY